MNSDEIAEIGFAVKKAYFLSEFDRAHDLVRLAMFGSNDRLHDAFALCKENGYSAECVVWYLKTEWFEGALDVLEYVYGHSCDLDMIHYVYEAVTRQAMRDPQIMVEWLSRMRPTPQPTTQLWAALDMILKVCDWWIDRTDIVDAPVVIEWTRVIANYDLKRWHYDAVVTSLARPPRIPRSHLHGLGSPVN